MRFRKKPVEIEAVQFDGTNGHEIVRWMDDHEALVDCGDNYGSELVIVTLEGHMHTSPGDYIIRGVQGEFYPCKPDIFWQTYEPA